jgi:N-acetylneuraminate lyase
MTMTHSLAGLYAALATPYTETDEISEPCLRELLRFILKQKIEGCYVGGSTGEALLQTSAERERVLKIVAEEVGSRAKFIGHVGALSTRESVGLAKTCFKQGYAAISSIPPIYFPYSTEDIKNHYRAIIEAAEGVPLLIYNIPAATGRKFSFADLAELIELPGVIGIKQTEVDMYQMEQLRRRYPELLILNGYDEVFLSGLVTGADGGVGSTYNIMGWRFRKLRALVETGDNKGALRMQSKINEVVDLLASAGVFPGIKFILHKMGIIGTPFCRRPLGPVKESSLAELNRTANALIAEFKEYQLEETK